MNKKHLAIFVFVFSTLFLSGCFNINGGKTPGSGVINPGGQKGNLTLGGEVLLARDQNGNNVVPLANAKIDIPLVGITETDEYGKFAFTGLHSGDYTIRVLAPIGMNELNYSLTKTTNNLRILIYPPEKPEKFEWQNFCYVSNAKRGTVRWTQGSQVSYYLDGGTNEEQQTMIDAFDIWGNVLDSEYLHIQPTNNESQADIIVTWIEDEDEALNIVDVDTYNTRPSEIREVRISINRKYVDETAHLVYHNAVARALGLNELPYAYPSVLTKEVFHEDDLKLKATEADLNYLRALYSIAPGTIIEWCPN